MLEISHAKEEKALRFAKKYFNEFITKEGKVNSNKSTEELYKVYMSYYDLYFKNSNEEKRKNDIEIAYKYLFYILEEQNRFRQIGELTTNLTDSYDGLIRRISEYSFKSEKENSINDNILRELSNFKEILHITISNINAAMKGYNNKEKIDAYYIETKRKIEELIKRIQTASFELDKSKNNYRKIWGPINNNRITKKYIDYSNLSEAKKIWKKKRNEACYELINLYKSLDKLNEDTLIYIWISEQSDELCDYIEPTTITLNNKLTKLEKSKNYYCYLSDSEKEKLDTKNKRNKQLRKILDKKGTN